MFCGYGSIFLCPGPSQAWHPPGLHQCVWKKYWWVCEWTSDWCSLGAQKRKDDLTSAREDVTWNRCHLEVAFELAGPWWVGGMGRLEARAQLRAQHKGWRCRGRRGPWPGCSACLPWAQGGSLHRCCCSLLRAHQCTPNRTVVSPTATSSVTSASRGSLGRLGEEGPLLPWTLTLALRA